MDRTIIKSVLLLLFFYSSLTIGQTDFSKESEELGKVHWYRDYDKAIAAAKRELKDVLILFQEVPGCATCRNYGKNVLSNPLMVETIENEFIPLAIFNNKGGKDREILAKFDEPSWNNPVVRIINTKGNDVVKRISSDYSSLTLLKRIKEALKSNGRIIPPYVKILDQELSSINTGNYKEKHFKMYCFWTGEKQLGKIDGVLSTESGFMNGEVVKVQYDPSVVDETTLENYAEKHSFKPVDPSKTYKSASNDIHYYLRHTDYKYVPLTELQQTKINSAIGSGKTGDEYLSPTQRKWFVNIIEGKVKKNKNLFDIPFSDAWDYMKKQFPITIASK
ncbi:VPGUxxT family thioredoxin-like (seleno)protein, type 2 [uncultured Croceitalea sp.]|uniref:VPGUxxT family thioredoxin-like (seleno)protein, type 2 n=1 Tax=uncultured Croceitalea sp. TaxID=1798908 RepID=UPI003305A3FD